MRPRAVLRALLLVAAMATLLLVGACAKREAAPPAPKTFKVALLLTGPISDDGWNQSAYEGLMRIQSELGAAVAKVESIDKSGFEENFRQFGAEGYDLVFGHAYEFQDAALRVAPDFPKTTFIVIAGDTAAANVGSVHFKLEDATYVLGALTAKLSPTKVAGMIGGEEIPSLKPGFEGFVNGAKSVDPSFTVVTKYVGNWNDVTLAKEHAEALIEQGARFIFQNADKAGLGVFQAAAAHKAKGVFAFGSNRDQNAVVPGAIFASAVLDVPAAYLSIAREVKTRTYVPRSSAMGSKEGVVSVVMSPEQGPKLAPELVSFLSDLESKIARGEIDPLAPPR
ncbi:MAG: BMP family protein [bacterium]